MNVVFSQQHLIGYKTVTIPRESRSHSVCTSYRRVEP